jgi:ubiquinone/menaquinone biosynthesis C-methylase UbiE
LAIVIRNDAVYPIFCKIAQGAAGHAFARHFTSFPPGHGLSVQQDKQKEIAFFDGHAADAEYDVFTPQASMRLVDAFVRLSALSPGARVADLGCGSGAFTSLLASFGYVCTGLDISPKLIEVGRRKHPGIEFIEGDVEHLPFPDASFDGVLLSGVVHHIPDPSRCAVEVSRVLRPNGRFVAFDPNRMNPLMWLYRDHASPFYSRVGVTDNERPVRAHDVAATFTRAGFAVSSHYLSGLAYRYVASPRALPLLPIYNFIDAALFSLPFMKRWRPFVLTAGAKRLT